MCHVILRCCSLQRVKYLTVPVSHQVNFWLDNCSITRTAMTTNSAPLVYHSLERVLQDFRAPENKDTNGVKELLEIYNISVENKKKLDTIGDNKKFPLIVLEGLDGSGKTTMGRRVAKKLHAEAWRTPPQSISHLRNIFDDHPTLRTAFYSLGNYIAALEVETILNDKPVVMDRYWHSTSAYRLAQAAHDFPETHKLPPKGDKIYQWPTDLFKPNVVLLLEVSEEVRLERHSRRNTYTTQEGLLKASSQFRENVIQAYKNMYDPALEVINANYSFGSTLKQIDDKVKTFFI